MGKPEGRFEATCAICFHAYSTTDPTRSPYSFCCGVLLGHRSRPSFSDPYYIHAGHVICKSCSTTLRKDECPSCQGTTRLFPNGSLVQRLHLNLEEVKGPDESLLDQIKQNEADMEAKDQLLKDQQVLAERKEQELRTELQARQNELAARAITISNLKDDKKLQENQIGNLEKRLVEAHPGVAELRALLLQSRQARHADFMEYKKEREELVAIYKKLMT